MPYEEDYKMWLEEALISMNPDWVCDGMYDTEFTHDWCSKYCGKDDAYITPKCLHMYYHHIARADRKDKLIEPQIYGLFRKGELSDDDVKELKKQIGQIIEYADRKTEQTEREGERWQGLNG